MSEYFKFEADNADEHAQRISDYLISASSPVVVISETNKLASDLVYFADALASSCDRTVPVLTVSELESDCIYLFDLDGEESNYVLKQWGLTPNMFRERIAAAAKRGTN